MLLTLIPVYWFEQSYLYFQPPLFFPSISCLLISLFRCYFPRPLYQQLSTCHFTEPISPSPFLLHGHFTLAFQPGIFLFPCALGSFSKSAVKPKSTDFRFPAPAVLLRETWNLNYSGSLQIESLKNTRAFSRRAFKALTNYWFFRGLLVSQWQSKSYCLIMFQVSASNCGSVSASP